MEKMMIEIIKRGKYLKKIINEKESTLEKTPAGKLRVAGHKGKIDFYQVIENGNRTGRYLAKDEMDIVRGLAQKNYDQKVLEAAQKELKFLNYVFKKYYVIDEEAKTCRPKTETVENIYESISEERQKLVVPVSLTDEQYVEAWKSQSYEGKQFSDTDPEFYTELGERVRSKSEVLIANMLYRKGVPYKYECPVILKQMGTVYPDFRLLDVKRRKEWYWEHLGMMEDPGYSIRNLEKIIAYEKSGIIPGRNLIITHETSVHPLNMRVIEMLVDSYLA